MAKSIRGKVEFANGVPATGVEIRVFDQDASGKQDDDLTLTAGLSDGQGNFEVSYDPGRFRDAVSVVRSEPRNPPFDWTLVRREHRQTDWLDVLLPYLRFDYTFQGQARQHHAPLNWFSSTYSLPQAYTTAPFSATLNGYHFVNAFKGVPLPFSIPEIPGLIRLSGTYGLCGGMSSSAYDHYLYGREIPANVSTPRSGSVLQRYLYRRQMDTFGTLGEYILKFASWMKLPDDTAEGLCTLTLHELEQFRARLANNAASVLGIVYEKGTRVSHLFLNHQVLGYALEVADEDHSAIRIYDPNYPGRDDVSIKLERRIIDH
ncbi:hypothetical protein FDZ74_14190, partial [bacterium]